MYRASWQGTARRGNLVLRTAGDPVAMTTGVRAALQEIAPTLPIKEFTSQTDQIARRVEQERLFALAYTAFGGLALLLACIGLYGLMSYNVARRTTEIGVRMALGAQRRTVVGMVLRESMWLVAIGAAIGIAAALWASRFVDAVVFGVSPRDPWTIAAAVGVIAAVSGLAGYLPARRASQVDPMHALRAQ
jgi:ABC-type antimicrobial peptide transport system permease subunit